MTDATLGVMNKLKRNSRNKIPFDSVLKNYRIKHPKQAFERIRYWDEGRKYDLLRCTTTLVYEKYEYLQHLASTGDLEDERVEPREEILALTENSSISNSIKSASSSKSNSNRSGETSISGVKTYQQLKKELFDWFKISRGPTLQKISQEDLFESAVLFFRNSRIRNPEAKIQCDRLSLDQIIDDINSNRAGATHDTLQASSDVHDLLAGCRYVSPNLIPLEIRQKPAPAKHRNLEQRFKDEVEILCDMFILRKQSRKRKLLPVFTDDKNKNTKKKKNTSPRSDRPIPSVSEVSSLSGLLD